MNWVVAAFDGIEEKGVLIGNFPDITRFSRPRVSALAFLNFSKNSSSDKTKLSGLRGPFFRSTQANPNYCRESNARTQLQMQPDS